MSDYVNTTDLALYYLLQGDTITFGKLVSGQHLGYNESIYYLQTFDTPEELNEALLPYDLEYTEPTLP